MNEATEAAAAIAKVFGVEPKLVNGTLKEGTRITPMWTLGEAHTNLPIFPLHAIMVYDGEDQPITWTPQGRRLVASTRRGTTTIIPKDWGGYFDLWGTIKRSAVYLPAARLQSCSENLKGGNFELFGRLCVEDPTIAWILKIIGQEECLQEPASRLFVEQAIDLLCTHLLRAHSSFIAAPQTDRRRGGIATWQVKRITDYMDEHLDQTIELDELANILGLSRFHFSTAFRVTTGMAPYQYLQRLRMLKAKELLLNPDMPIMAVALAVGYHTPSAFGSAFRKIVGSTPTEFRRRM